jgi:hypothetical protein
LVGRKAEAGTKHLKKVRGMRVRGMDAEGLFIKTTNHLIKTISIAF